MYFSSKISPRISLPLIIFRSLIKLFTDGSHVCGNRGETTRIVPISERERVKVVLSLLECFSSLYGFFTRKGLAQEWANPRPHRPKHRERKLSNKMVVVLMTRPVMWMTTLSAESGWTRTSVRPPKRDNSSISPVGDRNRTQKERGTRKFGKSTLAHPGGTVRHELQE